ncbi:hypothetical protein SUGI_0383970 [Cryptomeria japonica]|uniref:uncharacterized protein LOC131077339 n=1 Tax=Cryptomeria japonica TaxID=3369 RepID=UPI002408D64E|nr:uncharacterized protein LOC131077339 [Cryptomeria japonica]GLJ21012.1 hypothetical protein SUGI_0383970 [Cryptomeria japonica]
MNIQKRRVQLMLFVAGLVILSTIAEKCRQLVGEDRSSKSGKFTWINCFDMSSGTLACVTKEGVKLYVYNIRAAHVEKTRQMAFQIALNEAISGGLSGNAATKQAKKAGDKSAKMASRQARRIIGPILSSGWDFFEALYYGGTITEGCMRGSGTLLGAYMGGFKGEQTLGRFGYLIGSQFGSWLGGRVGLMFYDVIDGVYYMMYGAT